MSELVNIRLRPSKAHDAKIIEQTLINTGKWNKDSPLCYKIRKRSIDARRKIYYNLQIEIGTCEEINKGIRKRKYDSGAGKKVAIIGAGPGGMFAALKLLENGITPVIYERGKIIKERRRDIANIMKAHIVNPDSNYCYGEGGAGTFSDGKLYTRSSKRGSVKDILEVLVNHGATSSILVDAHPHIGTNKLPKIISKMRESITKAGGEIIFNSKLTDIKIVDNQIRSIQINDKDWIDYEQVILATGHSARDIYHLLLKNKVKIEAKGFAVGVRVEHKQSLIDQIQYKTKDRGEFLPPASYSLVSQVDNCGVYSFCMCPGGVIAPSATEQDEIVSNGWSPSKRNNPFANSGIIVSIDDKDLEPFKEHGVLAGMFFQKYLEHKAWEMAGKTQKAPAQRLVDFIQEKKSDSLPESSYVPGLTSVNLHEIFPKRIAQILKKGFLDFEKKMKGFLDKDAIIVGVETRSSSPIRIPRDRESFEHIEVKGLYPCGEGAGYAGGIVSAAIDGENCARVIAGVIER